MTLSTLIQKLQSPARTGLSRLFSLLGLLLVSGSIIHQAGTPDASLELKIQARLNPVQNLRLYHASGNQGFSEERAVTIGPGVALQGDAPLYRVLLETPEPVTALRIDTEAASGTLDIAQLEWITPKNTVRFTGQELLAQQPVLQHLAPQPPGDLIGDASRAVARLQLVGADPFIQVQRPPSLQTEPRWGKQRPWRSFRKPWVLPLGLALLLLAQGGRLRRWAFACHRMARRAGEALGGALSITLGPGAMALLAALPLVFALNVALKLHNSSIGTWVHHYGGSGHDATLQWGEPQEIRSDEWYAHTPWLLNQAQTGFKTFNPNIGPPGATLVAGVPVLHPTLMAQPQFWGYFLLDIESGFAWQWGFRALSLLGSVYLLLLLLTRGQTLAAVAGAVAVFGSSLVQWWYASWLTEIITGMSGALIGVFLWSHSRSPRLVYVGALLAALSGMHVVLHPYLPFLASLALLGLFMSPALLWEGHQSGALHTRHGHRLLALGLGAALFAALFWSYYATARLAVEGIMNTAYPGKRTVLGGDLGVNDFLFGLFEFWRNKFDYPDPATNPSEVARHLYLFPAVALVALMLRKQLRFGALFWSLVAYCLLAIVWMSAPLPSALRSALASMGLSYIPPLRMLSGLGLACTYLMVLAVVQVSRHHPLALPKTLAVQALCVLLVFTAWRHLLPLNPDFYTPSRLLVSACTVALLMWAVCRGQPPALMAGVALAAFMPMQVNPFSSGLAPILDKDLFQLTRAVDVGRTERWVVFGKTHLSQLLRANGHEVISGDYFVPRFDLLHLFDPDEKHVDGWNRYGPLGFMASEHAERIEFLHLSPPYPDTIKLHPCHPSLQSAGVTRYVFDQPPAPASLPCLKPLGAFEAIGVYVYAAR